MSKTVDDFSGDTRVDAAVQDGYRYAVRFVDGGKEYVRDHDDLTSVVARLAEARQSPNAMIHFSGARAVEGQMEYEDGTPPKDVIGEVRGKGSFFAADVRGIAYTRFDEGDAQDAAYQAAAALLDSQNQAQANALAAIQELQRKAAEGTTPAPTTEDPAVGLMG